jgi:flotillin
MQGVKVTGMLVWSIRRTGDGPFNAYKNLGDDLASGNPTTANDNLVSMASAIVRAAIANSTITDMLKKRDSLKATIVKDMDAVVKGWGVWLETVEITDVQISSHNLFKDLQAAFREEKKKDAEVYTMEIEQDLAADLTTRQLKMKEITDKNQKELSEFEAKLRMETQTELAKH